MDNVDKDLLKEIADMNETPKVHTISEKMDKE